MGDPKRSVMGQKVGEMAGIWSCGTMAAVEWNLRGGNEEVGKPRDK